MPLILLALMACGAPVAPPEGPRPPAAEVEAPSPAPAVEALAPGDLADRAPSAEPVTVRGWVSRVYTCPPCPPGAQCKPCMGNNIVLSQSDKRLADWSLAETDLLVFTGEHPQPVAGTEVTVRVEILGGPAPNGSTPHVRMLD